MKKYIYQNKLLLSITLVAGALYSVAVTVMAFILREIIDVALAKDMAKLISMLLITVCYVLAVLVLNLIYSTLCKKFIGKVVCALRTDVFNGVFNKNMQDFKSVNSADYLSALTNDIKLIEDNYLLPLMLSLNSIVVFIAALIIMLCLSPLVTICLVAVTLLLIVIPKIFKKTLQKRQGQFSKRLSRLTVVVKDFLSGFEVIRSYRMHKYVMNAFRRENNDTYKTKYSLDKTVTAIETTSFVLGLVVQFSIFFVCAYLIVIGQITAGTLLALVQVSGSIVAPIQGLLQNAPKIQGTKPIADRLNTFIVPKDTDLLGSGMPTFQNQIRTQDLRFGYDDSHDTINGINFIFERNKKYAVIGKSGCGKTTLVSLLNGYYSNYQGQILYDEQDIQQLDIAKLNEMTAIIHQSVYMFDETISDNICLHKQVAEKDLAYALEMSGVSIFLDGTKSLDTAVGENGSNLSGGQRQRIAVARALVQNKPILILDEGTSAIDMQTAYDIESRLLRLNNLTLITITHSLNPELLKPYDCIIFMADGQIQEYGTFDELISAEALFYDFYNVKTK